MPTKNPRLQITLKPETYEAIKLASSAVGASNSSICAELLDAAVPTLLRLQEAVRISKTAPAEAFAIMAEVLSASQVDAAQIQLDLEERKLRKAHKGK